MGLNMSINLDRALGNPYLDYTPVRVVPVVHPPGDYDGPYRGCDRKPSHEGHDSFQQAGPHKTAGPVSHAGGSVDSDTPGILSSLQGRSPDCPGVKGNGATGQSVNMHVERSQGRRPCLDEANVRPGASPGHQHYLAVNSRVQRDEGEGCKPRTKTAGMTSPLQDGPLAVAGVLPRRSLDYWPLDLLVKIWRFRVAVWKFKKLKYDLGDPLISKDPGTDRETAGVIAPRALYAVPSRGVLAIPTPVRGVAYDAPDGLGKTVDFWL